MFGPVAAVTLSVQQPYAVSKHESHSPDPSTH